MSEASESTYKPQGEGPHPTLGGNIFDPNVGADGMKGGQGVGGTSSERVMEEGAEHMAQNSSTGSGALGATSADDFHRSIAGTSSSTTSTGGGVTGWVKGALGFGGSTAGPDSGEPSAAQQHDSGIDYIKSQTGTTEGTSGSTAADDFNRGIVGNTTSATGTEATRDTTMASEPASNTTANAPEPKDTDVTTGAEPTASADPTTEDTAKGQGEGSKAEGAEEVKDAEKQGADKPAKTGASGGKLDNPDAIPTAGGERLGKKHWGESKIVPENPPRRESAVANEEAKKAGKQGAAGVSSADGQPNEQTASNTQSNTGGAKPPGDSAGDQKEGLMGKIKHVVHK